MVRWGLFPLEKDRKGHEMTGEELWYATAAMRGPPVEGYEEVSAPVRRIFESTAKDGAELGLTLGDTALTMLEWVDGAQRK